MTKTYTIRGRSDGFGAQYHGVMSGIAYCSFMNYKYIHTPFNKMGHRESPKALSDFIGIPVLPIPDKIDISKGHEQIVNKSRTPDKYYTTEVIETIRNHYYSTEKPIIENNDIAIHIRRGDVNSNTKGRYTGNSYYKKVIDSLLEKYPDYNINVFSEGKEEDFNELRHERVSLKLNVDIETTFHSLVSAKVLVMAKSSFSYCAAILNTNTIFYLDFWNKPLAHWNKNYF